MNRHVAVALACTMLGGCDGEDSPLIPRMELSQRVIDLGELDTSSAGTKGGEFFITNRGSVDLSIIGISSSCGCTVPGVSLGTLSPGERLCVPVSVRARHEAGTHSSTVLIRTNDPATPDGQVRVQWSERPTIAFDPVSLDLGRLDDQSTVERSVRVTIPEYLDGSDLRVEAFDRAIEAVLEADLSVTGTTESARERSFQTKMMRVRVSPVAGEGPVTADLQISNGAGILARLPISWSLRPQVSVTPAEVFRSGIKPGASIPLSFVVQHHRGDASGELHARRDGEPYQVTLTPYGSPDSPSWVVTVPVAAGREPGVDKHSLEFFFNEDPEHCIIVPITFLN